VIANLFTPAVRQWLYAVLLAGVPLLIVYGIVSADTAPLWIALGGAILGHGTATVALAKQRQAAKPEGKEAA
jgi:hypothetical protein